MGTVTYGLVLVCDFDGTIANTFEPSPNGIGVTEAYEIGVKGLYGDKGLGYYRDMGGLENRSPREVIVRLEQGGFNFCEGIDVATERLIRLKMDCLERECGTEFPDKRRWPSPTNGLVPFWKEVETNPAIFPAILSSGHREFIKKFFCTNGLKVPGFMLTDDELRGLPEPLHKPKPELWEYFVQGLDRMGIGFERIGYIGDDPDKDGLLVECFPGVDFFLYGRESSPTCTTFKDWRDLGRLIA